MDKNRNTTENTLKSVHEVFIEDKSTLSQVMVIMLKAISWCILIQTHTTYCSYIVKEATMS